MSLSRSERDIVVRMRERKLRRLVKGVATVQTEAHSIRKVVEKNDGAQDPITVDEPHSPMSSRDDVEELKELR